jgi:hypothetical protein
MGRLRQQGSRGRRIVGVSLCRGSVYTWEIWEIDVIDRTDMYEGACAVYKTPIMQYLVMASPRPKENNISRFELSTQRFCCRSRKHRYRIASRDNETLPI